jgi:hypothetical protein
MRDNDFDGDISRVIGAAERVAKHRIHGAEIGLILYARDEIENRWDELTLAEQKSIRTFDITLIKETDWILEEAEYLAYPERRPEYADSRYWWWFLPEIKAGKTEPPQNLQGAA